MSKQLGKKKQSSESVTPKEVRQFLLAEFEAGKQAIGELSDEELLEAIAGGGLCCSRLPRTHSAPKLPQLPPAAEFLVETPRGGLLRTSSGNRLLLAVPRPFSEHSLPAGAPPISGHSSPAGASPVSESSWASARSSLSRD